MMVPYVPYTSLEQNNMMDDIGIPQMVGNAKSLDEVKRTMREIKSTLDYYLDNADVYVVEDAGSRIDAATKLARTMKLLLVSVAIIVLIVGGSYMTYYYSSKTLKPLEKLNEEMNKINVNNLKVNLQVQNTGDEVDQLTKTFNTMTSKLHDSYILQKIFSANAAHELRIPLSVMQTKIDVFKMKDRSMKEYEEFLAIIEDSTSRLVEIVKDLLDFTNEQIVDMSESVNLREVVEEVIYELEDLEIKNKIAISLVGDDTAINGNDGLLQQAVYNLVENAIKYSNKNERVEIEILKKKEQVILKISDTGMGIPDEMK